MLPVDCSKGLRRNFSFFFKKNKRKPLLNHSVFSLLFNNRVMVMLHTTGWDQRLDLYAFLRPEWLSFRVRFFLVWFCPHFFS